MSARCRDGEKKPLQSSQLRLHFKLALLLWNRMNLVGQGGIRGLEPARVMMAGVQPHKQDGPCDEHANAAPLDNVMQLVHPRCRPPCPAHCFRASSLVLALWTLLSNVDRYLQTLLMVTNIAFPPPCKSKDKTTQSLQQHGCQEGKCGCRLS
eukprot:1056452-Rhodomonas_salina.3